MSILASPEGRNEACRLFANGHTLTSIARQFGVSKQRIHQITKKAGVVGGRKLAGQERRANKEARREARIRARWGCSYTEWKQFRQMADRYADTPMGQFNQQRKNATSSRNIEWKLTFMEWWAIWRDSGKWYRRGKMVGDYVMARFKDQGPYSVDNVYITTCSQNIRDGLEVRGRLRPAQQQ